jgi:1-acyl-sn-glycerol-3-phosphate acyltransferase
VSYLSRFRSGESGQSTFFGKASYRTMELWLRALSDYHQYEVEGLEHVPKTGGALLVFNHSLATYDAWLIAVVLHDELGRSAYAILDRLLLKTPIVGAAFRELGFIEGSRDEAARILREGNLLGVVPGGMREALRPSSAKYQVDWRGRTGFVWASLLAGVPIILAACPKADDIFEVADLELTRRVYDRYKLPIPFFRGIGPTLLPRRVKLRHVLSEPIPPPVAPEKATAEVVADHHAELVERMNRMLDESRG